MKNSILLLFCAGILACSESESTAPVQPADSTEVTVQAPFDAHPFYYPLDSLKNQSLSYQYQSDQAPESMYWMASSYDSSGQTYLTLDVSYEDISGIKKVEFTRLLLTAEGLSVADYFEHKVDRDGSPMTAVAKMSSSDEFVWNPKSTLSLVWEFESTVEGNAAFLQKVKRTRHFSGEVDPIIFKGDTLRAIEFDDTYHLDLINAADGRNKGYDFTQTSIYAEGIGLYSYARNYDGKVTTYTLIEIRPAPEK